MPANLATRILLTPDEQRRTRRPRVLLTGRMVYGPDWQTLDCAIRDLTPHGARLRLAGPAMLVGPLALIEVNSGIAHPCEITWRRQPEIGVRFQSTEDLNQPGPPELARLRRIWLDARAR